MSTQEQNLLISDTHIISEHECVQNVTISNPTEDTKTSVIEPEALIEHVEELIQSTEPIPHQEVLNTLLDLIPEIDYREKAGLNPSDRLKPNHYLVITIESLLELAQTNRWDICRSHDFIYVYNGACWKLLDIEQLKDFLGQAAERMGIDHFPACSFQFRDQLYKQFIAQASKPQPEQPTDLVLINLKNGTLEISMDGVHLRNFNRKDFITYQLPFEHNPEATAPMFQAYLDRVLPDKKLQMILAEYIGYVFIPHGSLKLEKTLLLYGTGANGKSVFFDIINALLGPENISNYSLQNLTNDNGYYRAMIANKLLNYSSEINGNLGISIFKQMVSGEPIGARLPYGRPMVLTQYGKLMFNCNELPKDVEHNDAYFRRFIIFPFEVTIPEEEQDKELAQKIIASELSGIFNWVLQGLHRLLEQKNFTQSDKVKAVLEDFRAQSDSIKLFLEEKEYTPSPDKWMHIKDLYMDYREFCHDDGFKPVNKSNFKKRLTALGINVTKRNTGNVAYLSKEVTSD